MTLDVEQIISGLYDKKLPGYADIISILKCAKQIFADECSILKLTVPIRIVGDIHGQFFDLLNMFALFKKVPEVTYLFLGDYVDRGYNSVETILLLLALKVQYPSKIYLLRGNHETRQCCSIYGFKNECMSKYDLIMWNYICDVFDYLPICAIINNLFFCVHGGISPKLNNIDDLLDYNRVKENSKLNDLFWSDPNEANGWKENTRGSGYLFGEEECDEFLIRNKLAKIIRSHQLVQEGYREMYNGKLITVWSAPNYCYKAGNMGSVLFIDENMNLKPMFFDKCASQIDKVEIN